MRSCQESVKSRDAIRVWQFNFELLLCVSESSRRGLQQLQSSTCKAVPHCVERLCGRSDSQTMCSRV